ncbi:MAG: hypothetical protein QGI45_04880, partial [Myxococcota bacterium]|nr:hypothetical protein [Myxococcota bacterium]
MHCFFCPSLRASAFCLFLPAMMACLAPKTFFSETRLNNAAHRNSDDGRCVVEGVDLASEVEAFFQNASCALIEIPGPL